jgi:hypothetical protein
MINFYTTTVLRDLLYVSNTASCIICQFKPFILFILQNPFSSNLRLDLRFCSASCIICLFKPFILFILQNPFSSNLRLDLRFCSV